MQIVVENHKFDYDMGCRMLKLKYGNQCPFPELEEFWADIKPLTFMEIAKLPNLEERRVGINCLGIERLVAEVNPKLIDKKTLTKTTEWYEGDKLVKHTFEDTYELFEVDGAIFSEGLESWRKIESSHYLRFKDTSTNREYLIWVDLRSVYATNHEDKSWDFSPKKVNAIQAIAWTIQTNIPKGNIEKIIRQGDCIPIKPKGEYEPLINPRHLTETEYKTLLVAES